MALPVVATAFVSLALFFNAANGLKQKDKAFSDALTTLSDKLEEKSAQFAASADRLATMARQYRQAATDGQPKPLGVIFEDLGELLYKLQHAQNFEESVEKVLAFINCDIGGTCNDDDALLPFPLISDIPKGWKTPLPRDVRPQVYWLHIQPYFPSSVTYPSYREFSFDATVTIQLRVEKPTDKIVLNSANLIFDQNGIQLRSIAEKRDVKVTTVRYQPNVQHVQFDLAETLKANAIYNLTLPYQGFIYTFKPFGALYQTKYVNADGTHTYMVLTHFENGIRPRGMLPCFDEPSFKAKFNVFITYPSDLVALSNGIEIGTTHKGNGWTTTRFSETPPMSSYLLALAVGDFVGKSKMNKQGTLVRAWAWRGLEWALDHSLDNCADNLDFFGQYFESPYPLPKQDLLAAPEFPAGAMENWGLVTFIFRDLYYDIQSQPSTTRYQIAGTVSHEIAHQWFGDLVTMQWWNDLFLNEGFAEYWSSVGVEDSHRNQSFYIESARVYEAQQTALEADSDAKKSHPIFSEEAIDFGPMTYQKGGALLRLLNYTLGRETLREGLVEYLKEHQYGNAVHENLWTALTSAAKKRDVRDWCGRPLNVSEFANRYFLQQSFPIVDVGKSSVSQRPVNSLQALPRSQFNYEWFIPDWVQNYGELAKRAKLYWIVPEGTQCPDGYKAPKPKRVNKWAVHNVAARSFFRTAYDDDILEEITDQLVKNPAVFDANSRSQMLDDLMVFAQRDDKSYAQLMEMTMYMKQEMTRGPWLTVSSLHMKLRRTFARDYLFTLYKRYMLHIVGPVHEKLAWHLNGDWDADTLRGEIALQACEAQYEHCVEEALIRFRQVLIDCKDSAVGSAKCTQLSPDIRRAVYCTGVAQGDESDFDEVLRLYKLELATNPYIRAEQDSLRYALSCTMKSGVVQKLLDYAVDAKDSALLMQMVQQPEQADVMWLYLRQNIARVRFNGVFGSFVTAMSSSWNTDENVDSLKSLRDSPASTRTERRLLDTLIDGVLANKQWKAKYGQIIGDWFWANFASQERSADRREWTRHAARKQWLSSANRRADDILH